MTNIIRHRLNTLWSGAQHIYLATPAHTIYPNYVMGLMRSLPQILERYGVTYGLLLGQPHIDDCRNLLVADFLKTDCTDLFFIDADVGWQPSAIDQIAKHDVDIVGGAYPAKGEPVRFHVKAKDLKPEPSGLIECWGLSTGFLRIRRKVITEFIRRGAAGYLQYFGEEVSIIFERGRRMDDDGRYERIGGDYNFCTRARELGFKTYVDPSLLFTHCGTVDFAGRLADHL